MGFARRDMSNGATGRRLGAAAGAMTVLALAAATATSSAHAPPGAHSPHDLSGVTTLDHTLKGFERGNPEAGGDLETGFKFLEMTADGEPFVVREELADAQGGRDERRESLAYFAQLTDFQLADEESPARVEFLDPFFGDFASSAWRPQEAMVAHQTEYTIRQVNRNTTSPVEQGNGDRAEMLNAVLTGDLADNAQLNETEWVVRLLEGGTLDPDSGSEDLESYSEQCRALAEAGGLDPGEADGYVGVQDYDDYPGGEGNEEFYDPDEPAGLYENRNFPTYEGLMDKAQEPFEAEGLEVPSYSAFGNHDTLAQGNEDPIAEIERIATGCEKVFPRPGQTANLQAQLRKQNGRDEDDNPRLPVQRLEKAQESSIRPVPPDERRQFVDHPQFKAAHATGVQQDEHGFAYVDPAEQVASRGHASYYDFEPTPGLRYIVLDTVSDGGLVGDSSDGNIDRAQFDWLEEELRGAQQRNELILVFAHHAIESLASKSPDEIAQPCTVNDRHGHDVNPGCDRDPRPSNKPGSTSPYQGEDLEQLMHRFPNAIALIAGHSHEQLVTPRPDGDGDGFWEIKTSAVVDWPTQHRTIDLMDNNDGTVSIFGTILDHDGPATSPDEEAEVGGFDAATLASVGRTLSYNDPQQGPDGSEGERDDRNVELLIDDPRDDEKKSERDCRGRRVTKVGTQGDDRITGTDGRDVIVGLDGDDRIEGLDGEDVLCGNKGDDELVGGADDDELKGGPDHDTLEGQGGDDELKGDRGEDRFDGGPGRDEVIANSGADRVIGGSSDDRLFGNSGDDLIRGEEGDDLLSGDPDDDERYGGPGDDRLLGGSGDDQLSGGAGRDTREG